MNEDYPFGFGQQPSWQEKAIVIAGLTLIGALLFTKWVGSQTDFEAPVTKVRIHLAGAPYGPYTPWTYAEVHGHDDINDSLDAIAGHWGSFRWVLYQSGPQACAFTAENRGTRQRPNLVNTSGRTIDENNPSSYFEEWRSDIWVAQGPCSEHNIPECTGVCR